MTSKLITPESPLLIPPLLAAEIGVEEAVILQQINYLCQISKHVKEDGRRWFWKTLKDWGQTLPFFKTSAIRRAIANLRDNLKLIDVCRHSQKTWYQANWFTINVENVQALWDSICQKQQIDLSAVDISICSPPTDHIKEFTSKEFASQQHDAVELKNLDEAEPKIGEQAPVTHFVDESELDYSTKEIDLHEDHSSALVGDVQKTSDAIVSELAPRYQYESELDYSTNEIDFHEGHSSAPAGDVQKSNDAIVSDSVVDELELDDSVDEDNKLENSGKPSKSEIAEICSELRRLRINPQPCLGVVRKHWGNVQGAIARVKDAIAEGWCNNPTGLFINSCKSGAKGKNAVSSDVSAWFRWAYSKRIVGAMSGGVVYTPDGEPVDLLLMMRRYPCPE